MNGELNVTAIFDAIVERFPERAAVIDGGRVTSYGLLDEHGKALAGYLAGLGIGLHRERDTLAAWECGQDRIGLYMLNCAEYLMTELAIVRARAVAVNINHRYVPAEVVQISRDAGLSGLIFHSAFAPQVAKILTDWPLATLIQVADGSDMPLLDGAIWLEAALGKGGGCPLPDDVSPDDLHILYTGGTTGAPKGVLWRQADLIMAGLGGRRPDGSEKTVPDFVRSAERSASRTLPAGPFMHASGRWAALGQLLIGNTVVVPGNPLRFDPQDILDTIQHQNVAGINIAGDAMARPLIVELGRRAYDLAGLRQITSGAAILSEANRAALARMIPGAKIVDTVGSTETGPQGSTGEADEAIGVCRAFTPSPGTTILADDLSRPLPADSQDVGWLARGGRVPLGYLGDREKTERAFRLIGGQRYAVSGDRAQWTPQGRINLLGRESATINTGGEKVFSEEVELALKRHPAVDDVIVCGRPSEKWGQEVVAIVALKPGHERCDEHLLAEAGKSIARYKLPKQIVYRDAISRNVSGKPDYAWALAQASSEADEAACVAAG